MGVDFADIDRDGRDDFFVVRHAQPLSGAAHDADRQPPIRRRRSSARRWTASRPGATRLFWNRGDGTYAEIANFAGVDASDWSWSVVFLDVDLDGYEDLLVTNGHAYDTQDLDMMEKHPPPANRAASMRGGKKLKDFPPLHHAELCFPQSR